jgi:hypothetical protein
MDPKGRNVSKRQWLTKPDPEEMLKELRTKAKTTGFG